MTRSTVSTLALLASVMLLVPPTGAAAQDQAENRISLPWSNLPVASGSGGTISLALPDPVQDTSEPAASGTIQLFGPRLDPTAVTPDEAAPETAAEPEVRLPVASLWPVDPARLSDGLAVLEGERDRMDMMLFVPPGAPPTELLISAVSSAFIMPGRSELRVFSGSTLIGSMPLTSITGTETARLPVAPGVLVPGYNRLHVEVSLTHRLYCGAKSSYDLWTRVDLSRSGVTFDPSVVKPGPAAFLSAVSAARGQSIPLLVTGNDAAGEQTPMMSISRQIAAVVGGGLDYSTVPAASSAKLAMPVPEIEIREGEMSDMRFVTGENGRQKMIVIRNGDRMPDLFQGAGFDTTTAEVMELPRDVPVEISRLGFETIQISEYLWRNRLEFRLPSDWLLNVRKRTVFDLDFAHLPGLPDGSELRLAVNGQVVRIVPLVRSGRLNQVPLEIRFDAGLLRAGRNTLAIEVNVPGDPVDQPCPVVSIGRLEISGTSTLTVPGSPNMHLPGLTRWLSDAPAPAIELATPEGDPGIRAMLPRLASALQAGERVRATDDRTLIVHRPADLAKNSMGTFDIGRQIMLAALQPDGVGVRQNLATVADRSGLTFEVDEPGRLTTLVETGKVMSASVWTDLSRLAFPDPASDLADWLASRRGQALVFQLDSETPETVHLVLADSANPESVMAGLERMRHTQTPVDGHLALLDWNGDWQTWTDTTRMPTLVGELDEKNWRGVVGNFASARPVLAVGVLTGIALLSVIFANSYVAASRRRS